jgi:putative SOS response-associated peptidase YedK
MCNHYANNPEQMVELQTWREFIGRSLATILANVSVDVWPKRLALIARQLEGQTRVDVMTWGVPLTLPGKRPGTTITKPAQRCLVPFTAFAEPEAGAGREEHWFTLKERGVGAFGVRPRRA